MNLQALEKVGGDQIQSVKKVVRSFGISERMQRTQDSKCPVIRFSPFRMLDDQIFVSGHDWSDDLTASEVVRIGRAVDAVIRADFEHLIADV